MIPRSESAVTGLSGVLHGLVADFRRTSGADIVSLFLYDAGDQSYFAPFAYGQPEESLLDSLADMQAQLGRYLADVTEQKAPDDLGVQHYGSTVWLTVGRRTLVARDAASEIDSTFVRRHRVESTVGLPLIAGDDLFGIVYLNYRARDRGPDDERVAQLERQAAEAAREVRAALASAERAALEGTARLTGLLAEDAEDAGADGGALRRRLSIALAELLMASDLDAAVVYAVAADRRAAELVTAHAPAAAPPRIDLPDEPARREVGLTADVAAAMAEAELHPAGTYGLGKPEEPTGYLALLSRDPLAAARRAGATDLLLRSAADLIGGVLVSRDRIATLARGNRLLGALAHLSSAMLRPGSSRQEVLEAVAGHLTDAAVPEFDFNFATVYLLDDGPDGPPVVRMAAGASTSDTIASAAVPGAQGARVPRWALQQERA